MKLELFREDDIPELLKWLRDSDERFLYQFSGPRYKFPLTGDQLIETINGSEYQPFRFIDKVETVGHCQFARLDREKGEVTLGRLLINPALRGKGYGSRMIQEMISYGKSVFGVSRFKLVVFDFNKSAIKCYEKVGFRFLSSEDRFVERFNETWKCITMELKC